MFALREEGADDLGEISDRAVFHLLLLLVPFAQLTEMNRIFLGDTIEQMRANIPDASVQCCVTSPPYWGLRDYGVDGQIGLEQTPAGYVAKMVEVFSEVWRVLRDDGVLWLNLGDSYSARAGLKQQSNVASTNAPSRCVDSLGGKQLVGIPWRVAFALQEAGWYLRQDIIWHKPNPMPESVTDRCTKAHEYIFLFTKSPKYYFDNAAIREEAVGKSIHDLTGPGYNAPGQAPNTGNRKALRSDVESRHRSHITGGQSLMSNPDGKRNRRSVWTVPTHPFKGAHFATFPMALIEPMILAASRPGDTVLDPFMGAGTTACAAKKHRRNYVGCELNPEYVAMAEARISDQDVDPCPFCGNPHLGKCILS